MKTQEHATVNFYGSLGLKHLLAAVAILAGLGSLSQAEDRSVYSGGHGDIAVIYDDATDTMSLKYQFKGSSTVLDGATLAGTDFHLYDPQSVLVYAAAASRTTRGVDPAWDFTGVAAGGNFHYLPQTSTEANTKGLPFLGTSAKIENVGATENWEDGAMTFSLVGVSGPGDFSLYYVDGVTGLPTASMATADGIAAADVLSQAVKSGHNHYDFGFSDPGVYDVTLRAEGTHLTDGLKSAEATFRFQIVPEPSSMVLLVIGLSSLAFGYWRRRAG